MLRRARHHDTGARPAARHTTPTAAYTCHHFLPPLGVAPYAVDLPRVAFLFYCCTYFRAFALRSVNLPALRE